jgi:hypothetical protein
VRYLALIAVLALLGLGAAGCGEKEEPDVGGPKAGGDGGSGGAGGGGGGGGAASPEEEITAAVEAVLGGAEPADVCGGLSTSAYVKEAYGDEQGCGAAVSKQKPFDVAVSAIDISGSTATAKAKPEAGPNEGETIEVDLVEEGDEWKVDSAVSNAPAGP